MTTQQRAEPGRVARFRERFGLKLAGLAMVLLLVAVAAVALTMFVGGFTPVAAVTVEAPRSGLVLDPDAKVRVRGVEIGRVTAVDTTGEDARISLALDPDQLHMVPSNARVDIRSTTVFGAKYINFVIPDDPSSTPLRAGATVAAESVTVEFDTIFQHLSQVLNALEPEKLNATLAAIGSALDGRGQTLGELLSTSDAYLREMNPYLPTLQRDLDATAQVTNIYADAAPDLLRTVDNLTVTGGTLVQEQRDFDGLLLNVIGMADTTGAVLRENETQVITALDLLTPTTALLNEYSPALYCLVNGLATALPLGEAVFGGGQEGVALNTNFMYGAEPYTYPRDLPKVNATGGPSCRGISDRYPGMHSDYTVTDTSEGAPYTPSTTLRPNGPKVFEILFAGMPGVGQP